jgi:hypothetical protein
MPDLAPDGCSSLRFARLSMFFRSLFSRAGQPNIAREL